MDVHIPRAITSGLRLRGVDVLTAQQDRAAQFSDAELLDRSSVLVRVLVTQDTDLLREAGRRHEEAIQFAGIIFIPQLDVSIGKCVTDLELCAKASSPEEWINRVEYLPF